MIPEDLKKKHNWVCWKSEVRNDKLTKIPIAPWKFEKGQFRAVSATEKNNLTRFRVARGFADKYESIGIGYSFQPEDDVVGIDLDDVRDRDSGEIDEWAEEVIEDLNSFTEISPSGTGFHVYVFGELGSSVKDDDVGIEAYDRDRFFTITGNHFDSSPNDMKRRQGVIDDLKDEYSKSTDNEDVKKVDPNGKVDSPFWNLLVTDIYAVSVGENTTHPIHGSTTGANFRVNGGGETATCFRHDYGSGEGCGLNAQMMLGMEATGMECDEIRSEWGSNDEVVFESWRRAVDDGYISPNPVPYRVLRHIAKRFNMSMQDEEEGILGRLTWRTAHRLLRTEFDMDVRIGDEGEDTKEKKKNKYIQWKKNRKEKEKDTREEKDEEDNTEIERFENDEFREFYDKLDEGKKVNKKELLRKIDEYNDMNDLEGVLKDFGEKGMIFNAKKWIMKPEMIE